MRESFMVERKHSMWDAYLLASSAERKINRRHSPLGTKGCICVERIAYRRRQDISKLHAIKPVYLENIFHYRVAVRVCAFC